MSDSEKQKDKDESLESHEQDAQNLPAEASSPATEKESEEPSPETPVDLGDSPIEAKTKVLEIDYDDAPEQSPPNAPPLGKPRKGAIKVLHALGDLHGWAPGLINYLVRHKLASVEIDGNSLGTGGKLHTRNIERLFGRSKDMSARDLPPSGLAGRPGFEYCVNGSGHGLIRARWIADDSVGFIQIGDVFDRSDHSEVAAEILRQLTIDAPNRVFTLVGNHEQFMLEGDFESWQMNEIRNAVTDHRDKAPDWEGRHLRFLATEDVVTTERTNLVFQAYRQSTQVLFLTQAAAQQRALGIDHGLTETEIDALLSPDWEPYQCASSISSRFEEAGSTFPGATVALVFGDTLFHHAEPNHKRTRLPEQMNWNDDFGWINYISGGGDIQKTPHSRLLWSRGASTGSSAGTPNAESMIELISVEWPGLFRIVHGHTPTVGPDEFSSQLKGLSTTVSYLAEAQGSIARHDKASRIRVYNIDEGMAPVYYSGNEGIDYPLRIPTGLRVASKSNEMKTVLAHHDTDDLLVVNHNRDVRKETRKHWKWVAGQNRSGLSGGWESLGSGRWVEAFNSDGINWLIETTEEGKALLSRRISEYDICRNVLLSILVGAKHNRLLPKGAKISPPRQALNHLNYQGGEKHFSALQTPSESWRVAKGLKMIAIGFSIGEKKNTIELYAINGTEKEIEVHLTPWKGKKTSHKFATQSVTATDVSHDGTQFAIHIAKVPDAKKRMEQWLGLRDIASIELASLPFIAHYPLQTNSKKKSELKVNSSRKSWRFPIKSKESSEQDVRSSSRAEGRQGAERARSGDDVRVIEAKKKEEKEKASRKAAELAAKKEAEKRAAEKKSTDIDVRSRGHSGGKKVDVRQQGSSGEQKKSQDPAPEAEIPSPGSSDGSSSELKEKDIEELSSPADTSPLAAIKFNEDGGFSFVLNTSQLREIIKKLPGPSQLDISIERVNDSSNKINVEISNEDKTFSWQLEVKTDENPPFDVGGRPNCKKKHDGISPKDFLLILSSLKFLKLINEGLRGPPA